MLKLPYCASLCVTARIRLSRQPRGLAKVSFTFKMRFLAHSVFLLILDDEGWFRFCLRFRAPGFGSDTACSSVDLEIVSE